MMERSAAKSNGTARGGSRRWAGFRALLFLSGVSLLGYIAYRYTLFQPPDHGSLYGVIFPLSVVLAMFGAVLAVYPFLLDGVRGRPGAMLRGGLIGFGALWMATGVACTHSLAAGIGAAPLGGSVDMAHMLSQHVFLPVAVALLAWAPARVAGWMGAAPPEPLPAREPALSPGY
ncbi:MAG: hypothetical protein H0X65_07820 [Gemmatimonadetes bacterium]|nr:hypothetical protein [Gemmatimonadota bacterium]